jgi:hypothetical protein
VEAVSGDYCYIFAQNNGKRLDIFAVNSLQYANT